LKQLDGNSTFGFSFGHGRVGCDVAIVGQAQNHIRQ
jgi:hypothetical protein